MKNPKVVTELDNSLIENMFLVSADPRQISVFNKLLAKPVRGHGLATAYASKHVAREFAHMMECRTGLDYSSVFRV